VVISALSIFGIGKSTPAVSLGPALPESATVGANWREIEGMSRECLYNMEDF